MSLKDYKPLFIHIKLGADDGFAVRGLNSQDIAILLETNADILEQLFGLLGDAIDAGSKGEKALKNFDARLAQAGLQIAQKSPQFMASVIALASAENSGEEGDFVELMRVAKTLPMPVQINAVIEIATQTFTEVGGIKKFISQVSGFLGTLKRPKANLEA